MNTVTQWLDEYGESHQHPVNKLIHWICVPAIVFSLLGMLWLIPFPDVQIAVVKINWCTLFLMLSLFYYVFLSRRLAIGMLIYILLMYHLLLWLDVNAIHSFLFYLGIFVIAWIGQFIGHRIEGKQPSFFRDVQFLLIGPLWLLAAIYRRLNLGY